MEKRLRRVRKMLDDVVNAVFHVGDAANCELRAGRRTRGTRGGRHKDRRREGDARDGQMVDGSTFERPTSLEEKNMQRVAVVKHGENLDKRRARRATARARKAEEESKLLRNRLKLRENKVGAEEVTVRECLRLLDTKEFHEMELDEALPRLEARWLHAESQASENCSRWRGEE